ncbi:hypothetical protein PRZ48_012036 [Zasmidium cellare]|uniref:Uncharacterized protein n=1 Tax=Zasmidium cellare TaxID=395010 RepID=A0ABR0E821_ZASCE|nr:hypothetical protein PRZ48_012036 [Zasmidium cellare]
MADKITTHFNVIKRARTDDVDDEDRRASKLVKPNPEDGVGDNDQTAMTGFASLSLGDDYAIWTDDQYHNHVLQLLDKYERRFQNGTTTFQYQAQEDSEASAIKPVKEYLQTSSSYFRSNKQPRPQHQPQATHEILLVFQYNIVAALKTYEESQERIAKTLGNLIENEECWPDYDQGRGEELRAKSVDRELEVSMDIRRFKKVCAAAQEKYDKHIGE